MPGVPGRLLEHVEQHPAQGRLAHRVQGGAAGSVERVVGDRGVGAGTLLVVLGQQRRERDAVDEELGVLDALGLPAAAAPGARFAQQALPELELLGPAQV